MAKFNKEMNTEEQTPVDNRDMSNVLKNKKEKKTYKSMNVDEETHKKLKRLALDRDQSIKDVVKDLVDQEI